MNASIKTQHITGVGTVFVAVSDQDAALRYYCDTLGFELRSDMPFGDGDRWIEVAPAGAETVIALVAPFADGSGTQPGDSPSFSYATDDLDAAVHELSARGVRFEEVMRMPEPVPPMVWFSDPDGNRVLIVQRSS